MSKTDLGIARILTFGILGRNGRDGSVNALGGGTDGDLNANHINAETNAKIWQLYNSDEGKAWIWTGLPNLINKARQSDTYNEKLNAANALITKLNDQISELGKRPTAEQLAALQKTADAAMKAKEDAEAELSKVVEANQAADKAGNAFLLWIGKIIDNIVKGKS